MLLVLFYLIFRKKKLIDATLDNDMGGRKFSLNSALPMLSHFSSFVIT